MSNLKLIGVKDVGMRVDIPDRGYVRTPIEKILLDANQLYRLINMHGGPRHVYIINPANTAEEVLATNENCALSSEDIFPCKCTVTESVAKTEDTYTLDDVDTDDEPSLDEVLSNAKDPEPEVETTSEVVVATNETISVDATAIPATADEVKYSEVTTETKTESHPQQQKYGYNKNQRNNNYKKN